jgi:hypothetical protein
MVTAIAWQAAAVMAMRIMLSGFLELGGAAQRGVDTGLRTSLLALPQTPLARPDQSGRCMPF